MAVNRSRPPTGAISARIVLEGGVLKLNGNPVHADYAAFERACNALSGTTCACVVVDLTRCTYLNSVFVGLLVETVTQMKSAGKKVRLYVSPEVGHFFNMAHLFHLFDYEVLVPAGGQD